MLKRAKQGSETAETSSSSTSDSNTFYEDDFSTTEDSSEEGRSACTSPVERCVVCWRRKRCVSVMEEKEMHQCDGGERDASV